jgi:hypothetical protein
VVWRIISLGVYDPYRSRRFPSPVSARPFGLPLFTQVHGTGILRSSLVEAFSKTSGVEFSKDQRYDPVEGGVPCPARLGAQWHWAAPESVKLSPSTATNSHS